MSNETIEVRICVVVTEDGNYMEVGDASIYRAEQTMFDDLHLCLANRCDDAGTEYIVTASIPKPTLTAPVEIAGEVEKRT